MSSTGAGDFHDAVMRAAEQERRVQREIDAKEQRSFKPSDDDKPMQAGAREYPAPPFPKQHLRKPGLEADLLLKPLWDAPFYKGSGKLAGKVALITGADSGIGRAVAVLFAREGADVAIAYLDEEEDARLTKSAVEKEGRRAILIPGDVAQAKFAEAAVERTVKELGRLDVLVNNAAFQEHVNDFEDLTEEHFDRTLKTNLYGYFFMAKAAVPHMPPGSAIVMTGSVTGLMGNKDLLDYSMTKGGIHAFTRSLATHLILTAPNFSRALRPEAILEIDGHPNVHITPTIAEAIEMAHTAPPNAIVFFTGSLFLVGEARALLVKRSESVS